MHSPVILKSIVISNLRSREVFFLGLTSASAQNEAICDMTILRIFAVLERNQDKIQWSHVKTPTYRILFIMKPQRNLLL